MIVLTVGTRYVEIDGYASCLAYRELLKMNGIDSKFVTFAPLNYSITQSLLNESYKIDDYTVGPDDNFIILDLSNKDFFPDFVNEDKIIELIDHHFGFENYWTDKLGNKSIIEPIGSVATIIVEKYEQNNLLKKMDKGIAKLLMAAILDNTLNFTAKITTNRDKKAYFKLQSITGEENFAELYFSECQRTIEDKLEASIVNDLKYQNQNKYLPRIIGQLTIWDIEKVMNKKEQIIKIMNGQENKWIINIISLKDNISYIICSDDVTQRNFKNLFVSESNNDFIVIKPAMLRKEIIHVALKSGL